MVEAVVQSVVVKGLRDSYPPLSHKYETALEKRKIQARDTLEGVS